MAAMSTALAGDDEHHAEFADREPESATARRGACRLSNGSTPVHDCERSAIRLGYRSQPIEVPFGVDKPPLTRLPPHPG